ncbi:hypothetical protein BDW02DRAFT_567010 [Decorospora gaudefroyi]|uniref:Ecp2 effector protein domain-containing protein n=1 Tax=Decorospora gaudefroyi TaxID=184978 RepID=A0A6A5KH17_9PLEO|nr:hypothetical protein BDW02DRAFT_567010 [Decorospora gaudefroyi]
MHLHMLILALVCGLVTALPSNSSTNGRGATVWKNKKFQGPSTAIPANNWCTDMNNIFGNWDAKTRSIKVEAGYKCRFYLDYGCTGPKIEFGSPDGRMMLDDLGPSFDLSIHSAYCAPLSRRRT